jgi:hypothetical protein
LKLSFSECQAYEWLKSYINEDKDEEFPGDSRQRALLQFWTGWTVVPFGGLAKRLKVAFLALSSVGLDFLILDWQPMTVDDNLTIIQYLKVYHK